MSRKTTIDHGSSATAAALIITEDVTPTAQREWMEPPEQATTRGGAARKEELANAIYWHIQAIRAVGRERVNTAEIARALGVSLADVEKAIAGLKKKGVKVAA